MMTPGKLPAFKEEHCPERRSPGRLSLFFGKVLAFMQGRGEHYELKRPDPAKDHASEAGKLEERK